MLEEALIDGIRFAQEGQRLQGDLAFARLPRVAEVLFDQQGGISYDVLGFVDGAGRPGIQVETRGRLAMICQRCLGCMEFELFRRSRLLLVASEAALPEVDAEAIDTETVPVELVASLTDLVEQEVLLGLPIAPLHLDETCALPMQPQASDRPGSPFAVLAQLRGSERTT
jgi:uncharacterized protein